MKPYRWYYGYLKYVPAGVDAELCFEDRANRGSTNIVYLFG